MLVLTRKIDESLLIGGDTKLTILSISKDKVRIGIEAPKSVRVLRTETRNQAIEENRLAVSADIDLGALMHLKDS